MTAKIHDIRHGDDSAVDYGGPSVNWCVKCGAVYDCYDDWPNECKEEIK